MKIFFICLSIYLVLAFLFGLYIESKLEYKIKGYWDYLFTGLIGMFWPIALVLCIASPESLVTFIEMQNQAKKKQHPSNKSL